jgi:hypothetical protein
MHAVVVNRHESAVGVWTQAEWAPVLDSPLRDAVVRIWHFDGTLGAARERVFPDGTLELIVQLDTPHRPGVDGPAERAALSPSDQPHRRRGAIFPRHGILTSAKLLP